MTIEVLAGGLLTTVQDSGRHGLYNLGFPPSGAMDTFSFQIANFLVGNKDSSAVLETTYLGPRLRFRQDRVVAITGADMPPTVDGEARPMWEAFEIKAGETLAFDYLRAGVRSYIAISGGIDVPMMLGSRSTYARVSFGGHEGRALAEGDELRLCEPATAAMHRIGARIAERERPSFQKEIEIRMVVGLYSHLLTEGSLRTFHDTDWIVTTEADRVGYRYRGAELEFVSRGRVPFGVGPSPWNTCSLNYPLGAIQVPGGIEPIVLMKDGVTGGNYASVGVVIGPDLDLVAQSRTHNKTQFVPISLQEALEVHAERRRKLAEIRSELDR